MDVQVVVESLRYEIDSSVLQSREFGRKGPLAHLPVFDVPPQRSGRLVEFPHTREPDRVTDLVVKITPHF